MCEVHRPLSPRLGRAIASLLLAIAPFSASARAIVGYHDTRPYRLDVGFPPANLLLQPRYPCLSASGLFTSLPLNPPL